MVHIFTEDGTFELPDSAKIDVFMVGGGGAGGYMDNGNRGKDGGDGGSGIVIIRYKLNPDRFKLTIR